MRKKFHRIRWYMPSIYIMLTLLLLIVLYPIIYIVAVLLVQEIIDSRKNSEAASGRTYA